jgi:hypothetical protein
MLALFMHSSFTACSDLNLDGAEGTRDTMNFYLSLNRNRSFESNVESEEDA